MADRGRTTVMRFPIAAEGGVQGVKVELRGTIDIDLAQLDAVVKPAFGIGGWVSVKALAEAMRECCEDAGTIAHAEHVIERLNRRAGREERDLQKLVEVGTVSHVNSRFGSPRQAVVRLDHGLAPEIGARVAIIEDIP